MHREVAKPEGDTRQWPQASGRGCHWGWAGPEKGFWGSWHHLLLHLEVGYVGFSFRVIGYAIYSYFMHFSECMLTI